MVYVFIRRQIRDSFTRQASYWCRQPVDFSDASWL